MLVTKPTFAGVDCNVQLSEDDYKGLVSAGYHRVGRYYCQNPHKILGPQEVKFAHDAGAEIFTVYEDGPVDIEYFTVNRGCLDAARFITQAHACGQPLTCETAFAVDYDAQPSHLEAILEYFKAAHQVAKNAGRLISVYGNGLVCDYLVGLGYAHSGWLSESSKWTGSPGYRASEKWGVLQLTTTMVAGISVDTNLISQDFGGCW